MGDIIYWKEWEQPKKWVETIRGKSYDRVVTGEYLCKDERVEKFWMYGTASMRGRPFLSIVASLIMKDGSRWESVPIESESPEDVEKLIELAEQYLKELK